MKYSVAISYGLAGLASALSKSDADTMFDAYNSAFLVRGDGLPYYKGSMESSKPDPNWPGAFDVYVAQDVWRRTGNQDHQTLVENLVSGWLSNTPPDWAWDGWNDDIAWFTSVLIRGYQYTGNSSFLEPAMNGNDYVFGRGWSTEQNGGGIWEQNPSYLPAGEKTDKQALSNSPNARVACMIYQSTQEQKYLDRCKQIYSWIHTNLYNATSGQVFNGVSTSGKVTPDKAAYNQGTFIDLVNLLWKITGDKQYYDVAKLAVDFGFSQITVDGIFSNGAAYLNSWADEFARGAGSFVSDNSLWHEYYNFFENNANAILSNRNSQSGLTDNAWDTSTPYNETWITNKYVSAVAWLQYTPPWSPTNRFYGIRSVINKGTRFAITSSGTFGKDQAVVRSTPQQFQAQRWLFSQNEDSTWNIVNLDSSQALEAATYGSSVYQNQALRTDAQRWQIKYISKGHSQIKNKVTGLVLDAGSSSESGEDLKQAKWDGSNGQLWWLQGIQQQLADNA